MGKDYKHSHYSVIKGEFWTWNETKVSTKPGKDDWKHIVYVTKQGSDTV